MWKRVGVGEGESESERVNQSDRVYKGERVREVRVRTRVEYKEE